MLVVKTGKNFRPERQWIIETLLGNFLGLEHEICFEGDQNEQTSIQLQDKTLTVDDQFFSTNVGHWLKESSLPNQPLARWKVAADLPDVRLVAPELPVLFGNAGFARVDDSTARLNLDIFGSAFFMMSRYEEVALKSKDRFGRFPAADSVAVAEDFIERPIINEYLEVLWECMKVHWPSLARKERAYTQAITCDVDRPYQPGTNSAFKQIRTVGADIVVRKSPTRAAQSLLNYVAAKTGNFRFDPYMSGLERIMSVNERLGNRVTFYFIASDSGKSLDGDYSIEDPIIGKALKSLHERGHVIGLHPGITTFDNADGMLEERNRLSSVLADQRIDQDLADVRQHYLLWRADLTPQIHESADFHMDSSMAFAERCGFRAGVCYDYPFFSIVERRKLNLRIRPLIVMDTTVTSESYMNFGTGTEAFQFISGLQDACRRVSGEFVLLWHNDSFEDEGHKRLYESILEAS